MEDDIEFEDLGGNREDDHGTVEVDLDAENSGISRKPRIPQPGSDADDDPDFDDLPRNRRDEPPPKRRGDGDGGGDDKAKTNAFQARLDRERRAKRRERERAEAAERRAQDLEARLKKAARQGGDDEIKALDSQIATVEADLEQALEAGKSKEQVRLTSRLTDLKAKRIAAEYTRDTGADDIDNGGAGASRSTQKNPLVDDFLEPHGDWYQRKGFERYTRMLNRLDKEVFDEGFDPRDDDYYDELNNRLKEKAPELFDESGEVDADGVEARRKAAAEVSNRDKRERASVVGAGDGGIDTSSRQPASSRVQLDARDFATMRKFGLDTNDKEVLKEFARNKRQRMLEEGADA